MLYGSEYWQVVETDFHKIEAFQNGCLRRICRIFWPRTISNLDLHAKTHSEPIQTAIKKRRLRHVLRMSHNRITRVALRWIPQGKRKQGRPKATWRRTAEKEIKAPWGEAEIATLDRIDWRQRVEASCSARNKEQDEEEVALNIKRDINIEKLAIEAKLTLVNNI